MLLAIADLESCCCRMERERKRSKSANRKVVGSTKKSNKSLHARRLLKRKGKTRFSQIDV